MANYNTASDCGCSQEMSQNKMPGNPCQASQYPAPDGSCNEGTGHAAEKSCNVGTNRKTGNPCQANMRQRQMANTQRQMAQIHHHSTPPPCQPSMGQRQMAHAPHPHHMQNRPSRPPMAQPCPGKDDPLAGMPIAMAYVPWQFFRDTYEPDKALQYGTIFPELNKPFYGKGGCPK